MDPFVYAGKVKNLVKNLGEELEAMKPEEQKCQRCGEPIPGLDYEICGTCADDLRDEAESFYAQQEAESERLGDLQGRCHSWNLK